MVSALDAFDERTSEALVDRRRLGYFSNRQHAALERAYARFRGLKRQLNAIGRRYDHRAASRRSASTTGGEVEAAIIDFYGKNVDFHGTASVVRSIQKDPNLISKFNEAFLESAEPRGAYQRLFQQITASERWREHSKQAKSVLRLKTDSVSEPFRRGLRRGSDLHQHAEGRRKAVIKRGYAILPAVSNQLHHTLLASWVRSNRTGLTDKLRSARDLLYTEIAEIPYPGEGLTKFSQAQKRKLHRMLEPGDVLVTYTGGYMSNLFLPGSFKHAITYVETSPNDAGPA